MKRQPRNLLGLLFACGLVVWTGCGQPSSEKQNSVVQPEDTVSIDVQPPETVDRLDDLGPVGVWGSQFEDGQGLSLVLLDSLADSTSVATLVARFNARFPTDAYPGLRFTKMEDGVPHVSIIDAAKLTQRMGSLGASDYLATATFTLTSRDDVARVHFSFPVGDHATPGLFSRSDWISHYENLSRYLPEQDSDAYSDRP